MIPRINRNHPVAAVVRVACSGCCERVEFIVVPLTCKIECINVIGNDAFDADHPFRQATCDMRRIVPVTVNPRRSGIHGGDTTPVDFDVLGGCIRHNIDTQRVIHEEVERAGGIRASNASRVDVRSLAVQPDKDRVGIYHTGIVFYLQLQTVQAVVQIATAHGVFGELMSPIEGDDRPIDIIGVERDRRPQPFIVTRRGIGIGIETCGVIGIGPSPKGDNTLNENMVLQPFHHARVIVDTISLVIEPLRTEPKSRVVHPPNPLIGRIAGFRTNRHGCPCPQHDVVHRERVGQFHDTGDTGVNDRVDAVALSVFRQSRGTVVVPPFDAVVPCAVHEAGKGEAHVEAERAGSTEIQPRIQAVCSLFAIPVKRALVIGPPWELPCGQRARNEQGIHQGVEVIQLRNDGSGDFIGFGANINTHQEELVQAVIKGRRDRRRVKVIEPDANRVG